MTLFQRKFLTILIPLVAGIALTSKAANGQIVPDDTLGEESSTVRQDVVKDVDSDVIEGGATRGANLFHSFSEFNVDAGRGAYFANPDPDAIDNILSRVTGSNSSQILGTLGVLGDANLFLINPNGIVFGENARLDVSGSFFASTADSLLFDNGFEFSSSDPQAPPLLTVNIPVGLGFRDNPGSIEHQSVSENFGLQVSAGETLALIGGDISFDGGMITALGGQVELGGLAEVGTVTISDNSRLTFPDDVTRADVSLSNNALVNVANRGGGFITVNARNLDLFGRSLLFGGIAAGLDAKDNPAGDINLNATKEINVSQASSVENRVNEDSTGNSGDIKIQADSLNLTEGGFFIASTFGRGNAGDITLEVEGAVELVGGDIFSTVEAGAVGDSGNITINGESLSLTDHSQLQTLVRGAQKTTLAGRGSAGKVVINVDKEINISGNNSNSGSSVISSILGTGANGSAGDIAITADSLTLENRGFLSNSTSGEGSAGNITMDVAQAVTLSNNSYISNEVKGSAVVQKGKQGTVTINAGSLSISDANSSIITSTSGQGNAGTVKIDAKDSVELVRGNISSNVESRAEGNGGNITIKAKGSIELIGGNISSNVESRAEGNGGEIYITAKHLSLTKDAQLNTSTAGQGDAGDVTIKVEGAVELVEGNISSNVKNFNAILSSLGTCDQCSAGDISITADSLTLEEGGFLLNNTSGQGNAGNVTIKVKDSVELIGGKIFSTVEERAVGDGGTVTINSDSLSLKNGAVIDTSTLGNGKAGNIKVDATDSVVISGIAPLRRLADGSLDGGFSSGLFTNTGRDATGRGGQLFVNTSNLQISDGAVLTARSRSDFPGGNIKVKANVLEVTGGGQILTTAFRNGNAGNINLNISDRISLSGSDPTFFDRFNQLTAESSQKEAEFTIDPVSPASGIFANTRSGSKGDGGSVTVQAGKLSLDDGAKFAVNNEGTGNGGSIKLSSDNLTLNNNSEISAATASGEGGNIVLAIADILLLENNSPITTEASGTGKGGDIKISADFTILKESNITANAFKGAGGKINITTQGLFQRNSEITASSEFGLDGVVKLDTPDIDPSQGVVELPVKVQDPNKLIAQDACKLGKESSLIVTGRGGLPPSDHQNFNSNWVDVDLIQPLPPEDRSSLESNPEANPSPDAANQERLIPAEGWVRNEKGEIFLVAYKSGNASSQRQHNRDRCQPK